MLLALSLAPRPSLANPLNRAAPAASNPHAPDFHSLATAFIPNAGQTAQPVRFHTHGQNEVIFFTPDEIVLALPAPELDAARRDSGHGPKDRARQERIDAALALPRTVLRQRFVGANSTPSVAGVDRLTETVNYLIGNDSRKWQTGLPTYGEIVYQTLYPGIDLQYQGTTGRLKST